MKLFCKTTAVSLLLSTTLLTAETENLPFAFPPQHSDWTELEQGIKDTMPNSYKLIGRMQTRHAKEINSSLLGIGGETQGRDFTDFDAWKDYLGPLGAKRIRLQSGWAKTEKSKGEYDFEWLDHIVDGCIERGVEPWLSLSYGNPIYEGGGGTGLGGGLMTSDTAYAAWDNYVRASIRHFRGRVKIYEVWNEADLTTNRSEPGAYARLFERTAQIIRDEQADAMILALALAYVGAHEDSALVDFVETLKKSGSLNLVDGITVHGYPHNPDNGFEAIAEIQAYLDIHLPDVIIWQGETGAPSEEGTQFALKNIPWSERTQAKWDLRRALAHWSREIPFSLFSISEMNYTQKEHFNTLNTKGKLKIRPEDLSVERAKVSYFSYRNLCSFFADDIILNSQNPIIESRLTTLFTFSIQERISGKEGLVFWDRKGPPDESLDSRSIPVQANELRFSSPVLVDLLTGLVFDVPDTSIRRMGTSVGISDLPVSDSPRLLVDRKLVRWTEIQNL